MSDELEKFLSNIHPSATLLSRGKANVLGNEVDAALIRNLYGQDVVWGMFNCDKGKFKGKRLANDCQTEEVYYEATTSERSPSGVLSD